VWSRAAFDANDVTITRPLALLITSISPENTSLSEPEASLLKMLVESQTSARIPSSPIAASSAGLDGWPMTGAASSFQSPVWKIRP
jgi:hypothetical protein